MIETVDAGVNQLASDAISAQRDLMGPESPANVRLRAIQLVLSRVSRGAAIDKIGPPLPVPEQVEEAFKRRHYKDPWDLSNH